MARKRMIDPKFWSDDKIIELEPLSRLCFIGLWNFSDDYGIHKNNSKVIKAEIFPADDIPLAAVDSIVENLLEFRLIELSEDRDLLRIKNWDIYQKINRPQPTKYAESFEVAETPKAEKGTTIKPKSTPKPKPKVKPYKDRVNDYFDDLTENFVNEMKEAYPNIDVNQELTNSKMWLLSNTNRAKKNFGAYINRLLGKAMDNNSYKNIPNGAVGMDDDTAKKESKRYNDYVQENTENAADESDIKSILDSTISNIRQKRNARLSLSQTTVEKGDDNAQ